MIISLFAAIAGLVIASLLLPGFSRFMRPGNGLMLSNIVWLMMIPGITTEHVIYVKLPFQMMRSGRDVIS